jgi:hypothetical protein
MGQSFRFDLIFESSNWRHPTTLATHHLALLTSDQSNLDSLDEKTMKLSGELAKDRIPGLRWGSVPHSSHPVLRYVAGMRKYLTHTRMLAQSTPADRNRLVDFWRATAILVVVFGHWLAASIWLTGNGDIELMNSLEWVPAAGWLTWIVQVMPIFFLAGGYANARALSRVVRKEEPRHVWITTRMRRLFTPVVPLLVVWVGFIVAFRPLIPARVVQAGAMAATVPLWFMAVYLALVALAPFTYAWWRRSGMSSVVALLGAAIAVDVLRLGFGVPLIGWVNFLFAWAGIHQAGYLWSDLDRQGISARLGWLVAGLSLLALILLTAAGVYPIAMLGIPGAAITNVTPPTFAIALLGGMQLGVIWGTQRSVRRFANSARGWHAVVSLSGVIMTVYLWHLTAMALVGAAGLSLFGGTGFRVEPGTSGWWLTRPLWLGLLALVTLGLVALFARFEWRISTLPAPATRAVVIGLILTVTATAAVAVQGLATTTAHVRWLIPIAGTAGAALVGALPRRTLAP